VYTVCNLNVFSGTLVSFRVFSAVFSGLLGSFWVLSGLFGSFRVFSVKITAVPCFQRLHLLKRPALFALRSAEIRNVDENIIGTAPIREKTYLKESLGGCLDNVAISILIYFLNELADFRAVCVTEIR
jgi:hypothetical protein